MEKVDVSRRGRIEIADIRVMDVSLHKAFGYLEFIPVYACQQDYGRDLVVVGISPKFDQIPQMQTVPEYDLIFNNGNIEVKKKE